MNFYFFGWEREMITAWNFVKRHAEWVYALACWGLGGWTFAEGDAVGGWTCVGIGVALLVVFHVIDKAREHGFVSVTVERKPGYLPPAGSVKGYRWNRWGEYEEPMPTPGEPKIESHLLGSMPERCGICASMQEGS